MPTAPLNQCAETGCNELTARHRCPAHTSDQAKQYKARSSDVYDTARWRALRRSVLLHHPMCQTYGCRSLAVHVDHIVALRDGGDPWSRSNLQALCKPCHSRKTAHEVRLGQR